MPRKRVKLYGYEFRDPSDSELQWFKANPKTTGMAASDGRIILNPYSGLSEEQYGAVAANEAVRLYLRENNIAPDFDVTPEQMQSFQGSPYAEDPMAMRHTILGRAFSGDLSAGTLTPRQMQWLDWLKRQMEGRE